MYPHREVPPFSSFLNDLLGADKQRQPNQPTCKECFYLDGKYCKKLQANIFSTDQAQQCDFFTVEAPETAITDAIDETTEKVEDVDASTQIVKTAVEGVTSTLGTTNTKLDQNKAAIDDLKGTGTKTLTDVATELGTLQSKTDDVKTEVGGVQVAVASVDGNVQATKNAVDANKAEIVTLQGKADATNTALGTTNTKLDENKTAIDALKGTGTKTLTDLATDLGTLKTSVDAGKASTDLVKTAVDSTKTAVDSTKTAVDEAKTEIEGVQVAVASVDTNVQAAKAAVDANKAEIVTLQGKADATNTKLDLTKAAVDALKGASSKTLSDVATDLGTLKTSVDAGKASTDLVKTAVDGVNTNLGTLQTKTTEVKDAVGTSNSKLDALSSDVNDVETAVAAVYDKTLDLETVMTAVKTMVQPKQSAVRREQTLTLPAGTTVYDTTQYGEGESVIIIFQCAQAYGQWLTPRIACDGNPVLPLERKMTDWVNEFGTSIEGIKAGFLDSKYYVAVSIRYPFRTSLAVGFYNVSPSGYIGIVGYTYAKVVSS